MKYHKLRAFVCSCLLLAGCEKRVDVTNLNKQESGDEGVAELQHVQWIVEPTMDAVKLELFDLDGFEDIDHYFLGHTKQRATMFENGVASEEYDYVSENSCGIVSTSGFQVYDFDGNTISEFVEGNFVEDDLSIDPFELDGMWQRGLILHDQVMYGNFVVRDFVNTGLPCCDVGYVQYSIMDDVLYAKYYAGDHFDTRVAEVSTFAPEGFGQIVHVVDDVYKDEPTIIGIGGIDKRNNVLWSFKVDGIRYAQYSKVVNNFVNCRGVDGRELTVNVEDGSVVTRSEYDEIGSYSEGVIPVCKEGRWGFIDASGKLVTDLIFDDVSTMFNGRVFVIRNGKAGILDLKDAMDRGVFVNEESL